MILYDELYFEITLKGTKSNLLKFASFLRSGALEDFLEVSDDYICYDDDFDNADPSEEREIVFTNDDFAIEIDEFCVEDFLEQFCKGARALDVQGHLYDAEDEEFRFISEAGDADFINSRKARLFNDELDAHAKEEETENEEE